MAVHDRIAVSEAEDPYIYTLEELQRVEAAFGDWETSHGYEDELLEALVRFAAEGGDIQQAAELWVAWSADNEDRTRWYA